MKTLPVILVALIACLVGITLPALARDTRLPSASDAETTASAKKKIQWETDYNAAMKKARETNKPVMIDFFADWCGPCKMMDNKTFSDDRVIALAEQFVSLKIDGDANESITRKHRVEGFPTILFLKSDGKILHTIAGFRGPEDFVFAMNAVLKGMTPEQWIQSILKKGPANAEENRIVGMHYLEKNELEPALQYLEKAEAGLTGAERDQIRRYLPLIHLELGQLDKAEAALERYKADAAKDDTEPLKTELRIAIHKKDRARVEKCLDRFLQLAKTEMEKQGIQQFRDNLDNILGPAKKPGEK
jgi:thioredoxin-like negative regulator of GroEL